MWKTAPPVFIAPLLALALSACTEASSNTAGQAEKAETEVSVITLSPEDVSVSSELAGRTVASSAAEVRPQVSGLVRARVFTEGREVKAGDVLYEIEPASYQAAYDSAAAALERAGAAQRNAQARIDRLGRLRTADAVSSQDYDDAALALGQAVSDVAAAKAAIETARINLQRTAIRAPISGRVDRSSVNVGALVTAEQAAVLTTIRQLDPIYVEVSQPSARLLSFRRAAGAGGLTPATMPQVRLTLEDGLAYPHAGKLQFYETTVSETAGTVVVRAAFPNPDHLLLPGMYVRATIDEGVMGNSFLVPQRAVTRNRGGEALVKIVGEGGKVEERTLAIDRRKGNSWVVTAGLSDGARLIVEGAQSVRSGETVKALEVAIDDATGAIRPVAGADPAEGRPPVEVSSR
ncbi:efflux RND transporter periplasmic adaptor subunit [Shinella sp. CPCC 101442]|uniref:efflux RND transporter periplasmic adaptor subunit n=1 Tax=Shinella sp. CPCC 101442 TaxID=2932265 RepID=UPI00215347A9|nr:efflux RND transporter periplasmic adaptor subunit [Shinella sp. CPCC 101442]MCR6502933.1 efflux RND transporter periplasmic adaptor subunit [Shinella sp. CPCC 101442]